MQIKHMPENILYFCFKFTAVNLNYPIIYLKKVECILYEIDIFACLRGYNFCFIYIYCIEQGEFCPVHVFRVPFVLDLFISYCSLNVVIHAACYPLLEEIFTSLGKCRGAHKSKCMEVSICIFPR